MTWVNRTAVEVAASMDVSKVHGSSRNSKDINMTLNTLAFLDARSIGHTKDSMCSAKAIPSVTVASHSA